MQTDERRGLGQEVAGSADPSPAQENLALLYQGLLTGIVRLQSQRQRIADGESFRKRTKATLQEVEQVAVAAGYDVRDVKDTHFAVVAFLDSVVLHSKDPVHVEWESKTLQEELFGKSEAGVVFFEKLEHFRSRRDSQQLADILEVYLLCLLLGFEGRYSGAARGDLDGIIQRTRMRIQDIRGRSRQISPTGALPSDPAPPAPVERPKDHFRLVTLGAVILTILCFILCLWTLNWDVSRTSEQLRNLF
jgi:type VI secretion system protein ImpK